MNTFCKVGHRLTAKCPASANAGTMTRPDHAHARHVGCIQSGEDRMPCEMPRWLREGACLGDKRADDGLHGTRRLRSWFKRHTDIHQGLHNSDCCPSRGGERRCIRTVDFFKTAVSIFTSMPNIRCLRLCWQVRVVKPTNTIVNLRTRSLPYLRIGPFEKELDDLAWCGRAPIQLVRHAN
jgi:hypothetical protein